MTTEVSSFSPRASRDARSHKLGLRRRRSRRAGRRHRGDSRRSPAREWAEVLDGLFVAIEETAWAARGVAGSVRALWERSGEEARGAQSEFESLATDAARTAQTGIMLALVASGYRLHRFKEAFVSEERAGEMLEALHGSSAARFYEASATHGGAFMKVGQLLSARSDLLPMAWIRELEKLQDAAPELPFTVVRRVVEEDFGRPLSEVFASFDEAPVAAASIGQVHRARTLSGQDVAVKVQRPGVRRRILTDLDLLETFVGALEASLPETDYDTIVREVREAVLAEVDYAAEARTSGAVAGFLAKYESLGAPAPVSELCSERVLTTHFVAGEKITDVLSVLDERVKAGDVEAKARLSRILGSLLEAYLRQVLELGTFQADPHPGNLFVTADDRVVILDFGCAGRLEPEVRARYLALMGAFMVGDRARMAELFGEIGFRTRSGRPDTLHRFADALLTEIRDAGRAGGVRWPTSDEIARRLADLLEAADGDPVVALPGEFVMIARVFGTLGGLFARYRPDLDFARHVLPVLGPALFSFQEGE